MRVIATEPAVRFIRERGGALYVWADVARCPGCSVPFLEASTEPPQGGRRFARLSGGDFELFYDSGGLERPGRLVIELRGWRTKRLLVRTPDFWIKE